MGHVFMLCAVLAGASTPVPPQRQDPATVQPSQQAPVDDDDSWREVRPDEMGDPPREAALDHGIEKPDPPKHPQYRTWMLFLGGLTSAVALVLWLPLLVLGPPTLIAVGVNAIATLLSLVKLQRPPSADRVRLQLDLARQQLRTIDLRPALEALRHVNVLGVLSALLAALDSQLIISVLRSIDVGAWLRALAGYKLTTDLGANWWQDPRIATAALVTVGVLGLTLAVLTVATVTILPIIFFAASFVVAE